MKKKNINIVIADDESLIRMDLKEILEENGYNVIGEAKNGREVIELCQKLTPDLLILDIKMPELDGLETLKVINSSDQYPKFPVIMLTAYSQTELVEQAVSLGVFAYIVKPIKEHDLLPSIEITIVEDPNLLAASRIISGLLIAAVFKATLSAPALKTSLMSLMVRNPPPTVKGIKISFALFTIIMCRLLRLYKLATMSIYISSSAPVS